MSDGQKTLSDLGLTARSGRNPVVTGIAVDSRDVQAGCLFAAMPGTNLHGAVYIEQALDAGATSVLTDVQGAQIAEALLTARGVAVVVTSAPREVLARTASLWFGAQPPVMVAITGTNGKTSVANFVRQIWTHLGHAAINLGTTGVEGSWSAPLAHTTPEPITLHRVLAQAAHEGITHAAMEASSHGLDQRRLDGVTLRAAGFTNLSQDHLDYHDSFEDYFAAKAGLFARVLPEDGRAVVNIEENRGVDMAAIATSRGCPVVSVGRHIGDFHLGRVQPDVSGQTVAFKHLTKQYVRRLSLIGDFQAENVLLAAALVIACGESPGDVFDTLEDLQTVKGRMQLVATRQNSAPVFVDYAHTPAAIATALKALRPHVVGRLIAIIGAGGDRDATKRPLMGQAAADNADLVFVTDDNPRSEDPAAIRSAVLLGAPDAHEVGDRAEAILRGVDALGQGDALLIAGKGHETGQVIGTDVYPFDDAEQASVAVAALDGRTV
ncbi:MAG: UDP-N-acetylmuramoyl-L-alanyl-D-glutamate--2,6-diaminopimelate ligase [Roseobacter sp.]